MEKGSKKITELKKTIGVLLLGFGGPDSLEAVQPFLYNLFLEREGQTRARLIAERRSKEVAERYKKIGGRSPLLDITKEQAQSLERRLNVGDGPFKVYIAMRYWHPFIEETIRDILRDGIKRIVALSLSPHFTRMTTGSIFKKLKEVLANLTTDLKITYIDSWYNHQAYINALVEKIEEGISQFPNEHRNKVQVIFSAHSVPKEFIEGGDPYLEQLKATIAGVLKRIGLISWHLAFQSRSGPVAWLEPETDFVLDKLAKEGHRDVLIVPISFVSDHVETLYDIDIIYRQQAESKGITFRRTPSLNASPKFIEALAQIVREHLSK